MGRRGPAPTPTRLLELRGSWRAGSRRGEPRPKPRRPRAPDWLSEEARAAYEVVSKQLHALELLSPVDGAALGRYADLFIQYRRCAEFVAKHGDTFPVRARPRAGESEGRVVGFKTYPQARRQVLLSGELMRLEREFGLTPAARARLATAVESTAEPAVDYFSAPARTG